MKTITDAQTKLGQTIRQAREQQGFSQENFAFRCGLHRTYLGAVERGERNISLQNILKIAEALGTSASELMKKAGI